MKLSRFHKSLLITLFLAVGLFVAFHAVSAQNFGLTEVQDNTILGSGDIRVIVARIIRAVLGLLAIIAVSIVLYAGYTYMTSGGDEEKIGQAKKLLINGVIGLAIILSSFAIVQFVISRLSDATGSGNVDLSVNCSDAAYASLPENQAQCNPGGGWSCDDNPIYCAARAFVVKSITPQTAEGNINDVVIRLVFSRAVDTPADQVVTIKRNNVDVTNEFVYSYLGGTDNVILEANYKPELSECKSDNAVCVPVGIYAVAVNTDTVVDRRGERLKAKVGDITFPTITSFTLTTIKKIDFQVPRITALQINNTTGDKVSLPRGATYPINARIEDNAGISYVRLSVQRQGSAGSLTVYEGPLETSNSPYDFSYPFVLSRNATLRDKYTVTVQAYDINHLSTQSSFEILVLGEHCGNGEQDGDETGTDSGGSCSSDAGCKSDIECTSQVCNESTGLCVEAPVIKNVSPWNGKPGNWITIEGDNFGRTAGKIEFGTDTDNDGVVEETDEWTEARLAQCTVGSAWNNNYIVTVVPVTPKHVFTKQVDLQPQDSTPIDVLSLAGVNAPYTVNTLNDVKVLPKDAKFSDWQDTTTTIRYQLDTLEDNEYDPDIGAGARSRQRMIVRSWPGLQISVDDRWLTGDNTKVRWFSIFFIPVGKSNAVQLRSVVPSSNWKDTETYSIVTKNGKTYLYRADALVASYDGVFDPGALKETVYLGGSGTAQGLANKTLKGTIIEYSIQKIEKSVASQRVEVDAVLKNKLSIRVTTANADVRHYEFYRDTTTDRSKTRPADWADNGLFTLNDIPRPGLCSVVTEVGGVRSAPADTAVIASGSGFGDRTVASAITFGANEMAKDGQIRSWGATEIKSNVPRNINPKKIPVFVTTANGEKSNGVPFTIVSVNENSRPDVISVDPTSSTPGSLITISGLRFGDSGGEVFLAPRDGVTCTNIAADGCIVLSLPQQCADTWRQTQIIATVPKIASATYAIVVKNKDLVASSGDVRFGVLEDTGPQPGICQLLPDNGPAPRRDLNIFGVGLTDVNKTAVPTVYFWKRGATGNLSTWLASNTHTSWTDTLIVTDIPAENGYSMPAGPGPIKVRVNGKDSNSLIYTVGDCTLMETKDIPSGTQCCRVGKEKGVLKSTDQMCEGETREAGYVWRFTTGKISSVPHVVENECPLPGGAAQFPSPTPWSVRKNGSGVSSCTNASIAVKFSAPMDPETLTSNTVKVYTCETRSNGQANCEGANKKPAEGSLLLRYSSQILTIREVPSSSPLAKDTWYRVELSKKISSKEPVTVLGVAGFDRQPLQANRPCGKTTINSDTFDTAYCFEFKTGKETCELAGAGIEPPTYTANLLGLITDPRGSQNPFYFTLWGKANQECSVISIKDKDWDWESQDKDKVVVTPAAPDTSRATIEALADTGVKPVDVLATLLSPRQAGNTTINGLESTGVNGAVTIQGNNDIRRLPANALVLDGDYTFSFSFTLGAVPYGPTYTDKPRTIIRKDGEFAVVVTDSVLEDSNQMRVQFYRYGEGGTVVTTHIPSIDRSKNESLQFSVRHVNGTYTFFYNGVQVQQTKFVSAMRVTDNQPVLGADDVNGTNLLHGSVSKLELVRLGATITEKLVATTTIDVKIGDPDVLRKWPTCTDACTNASIGITFDRRMMRDEYEQGVVLQKCKSSSCDELDEAGPVQYTTSPLTDDTTFRFTPKEPLALDAYYLVTINNTIHSIGQIKPSGIDAPPTIVPGKTIKAQQWKFKTKAEDGFCQVEDVSVIPLTFTARMFGQRTQYGAAPLGAPDSCSEGVGQELDPWQYGWNWSVKRSGTNVTDTSVATVTNFVSAGEPHPYCSVTCLPLGSIIPFGTPTDALCGNERIDPGEDCDIGIDGETAGESCTYRCLRPGNTNKGNGEGQCGNTIVNTDKGEECDPADVQLGKYCTDTCTHKTQIVEDGANFCGDREVNEDKNAQGQEVSIEDCDVNHTTAALRARCSATCVNTGTSLVSSWCTGSLSDADTSACRMAQSVCGNGEIEHGEECEVGANGKLADTCSTRCLLKNVCNSPLKQCDKDSEGCNDDCTFAGSSVLYSTSSLCGDGLDGNGKPGIGESADCELPKNENTLGQNPIQVVTAEGNSGVVADQQTADIMATIVSQRVGQTKKPVEPAVSSVGKYTLQCGYSEYKEPRERENAPAYNDCPGAGNGLINGVASNSCCYPRPSRTSEYPSDGAGFAGVATPVAELRQSLASFQNAYPAAYVARRNTFTGTIEEQELFETIDGAVGAVNKFLATPNRDRDGMLDEVLGVVAKYQQARDAVILVFENEPQHQPTAQSFANVRESITDMNTWLAPLDQQRRFAPVVAAWHDVESDVRLDGNAYTATPMNVRGQFILLLQAAENFDTAIERLGQNRSEDENRGRAAQALIKASDDFQPVYAAYKTSQQNVSVGPTMSALETFADETATALSGGGVCRNTLITVVLNDEIDPDTVLGNIMIASATTTPSCSNGTMDVSNEVRATLALNADQSGNIFIRLFHTVKEFFLRIFGKDVYASKYPLGNTYRWCSGNVTATPSVVSTVKDGKKETTIALALDALLDKQTYYAVVLRGGVLGIKSVSGVGITSQQKDELTDSWMFRTGNEICKIDRIRLSPESHLFNEPNQSFAFTAYAESKTGGAITPIKNAYDWVWSWGPQNHPVFAIPAAGAPTSTARTLIASKTVEGQITGVVSARVIADSDTASSVSHLGTIVSDTTELISDFCEQPWSGGQSTFPYKDPTYNYSMSYCADAGVQGTRKDNLPYLRIQKIQLSDSERANGELWKALLVDATSTDAIGIRVLRNEGFLPASEWYGNKFPAAKTPESLTIAGYDAVKDGDTYYISFLNLSSGTVYSNILVLTLNTGAQAPTRNVFGQLLETLKFNVNIKELGYCLNSTGELRDEQKVADISSVACSTDFDCRDASGVAKTNLSGVCSNARTKFQRDWKRLHDIAAIQDKLKQYRDDANRGNGSYPNLSSGTFIPQYTASYWPSWGSLLSGIPKDQINKKTLCEDPNAESSTCWNAASSTYSCPGYSSAFEYAFNASTNDYMLYGRLEYFGINEGTVTGLIDESHFTNGPWCQPSQSYSPFGEKCGDGVVQTQKGEECEGTIVVTGASCATGVLQRTCNPTTCRLGAQACVAVGRCGDGVTQAGEECDEGLLNNDPARNNSFGHCTTQCKRPTAFCGNGDTDDGERCDATDVSGQWMSYNKDKNKSCSFDCQGFGGYCGDDIKQEDEQCEVGDVQNTTELCFKRGDRYVEDAPPGTPTEADKYPNSAGYGYSEHNTSFWYTFPLERGNYELSIEAFNFMGDDFSAEQNVQDGACSNIPGVQLHFRVTMFNVANTNDPGTYIGDTCINAVASTTLATGKVKTGPVNQGTYRFAIAWDNDWGRTLVSPDDGTRSQLERRHKGRDFKTDGSLEIDTDAAINRVFLNATRQYQCRSAGDRACTYLERTDALTTEWTRLDNPRDLASYTCVPSAGAVPTATPGSCGDGVKQNNEVCDAGLERNENGRTVGNGVVCSPEYGKACSYCSNDCKKLQTIDATAYCGNGRIDQINQSGSAPVYEACDVVRNTDGTTRTVSSTATGGTTSARSCPVAGSVGGFSCNATCTSLVNSCLACIPIEGGGAIPKIAVLNVLTPSSTLLNAEWGRTTEKELYRKGTAPTSLGYSSLWDFIPNGPNLSEDIDYRKYTDQQWMFTEGLFLYVPSDPKYVPSYLSAYHGIEANSQCGDKYAVYFNKGAIDSAGPDENLQNPTKGSLFDYPVAGQSAVVENELVLTPVPRPGEFRVVVRWPNNEKNIKLGGIVYNDETYGGGGVNRTTPLFYNMAAAKANNTLCNEMTLSGGSATAEQNRYWVPPKKCGMGVFADTTHQRDDMLHYGVDAASYCSNGVQCSFDRLLYMYEMGSIADTSAQSLTINAGLPITVNSQYFGTTQPKPYAYVVEGITGPLSEYLSSQVYVDVYIGGKDGVVPRYSIYKPDFTFSMREAAAGGSTSNRNFKYWHVFNIVKVGNTYKISTSTTGLNGSLETEWDSASGASGVLGNYRRQQ